ncbi:putative zinc metalloproteinase [Aspergillus candidus]|uniref:WLM domain-domain-containing protein n=1 Tax=Aspergillus candidus TaxID=41067 RepID=A0A2I2F745_ASPCN|nr:WLM domain-domain-containing protein [Aspergillus candidus]PLB36457.1 WLM domain-domain-containing protein [Aspergillus candidus]
MDLTIHHSGTPHKLHLPDPTTATLQDLASQIASTLHIPPENQKLLIAPKPGMQKPPFAATPLHTLIPIPLDSPRLKITLFGTPSEAISALHAQGESTRRQAEARAQALASQRQRQAKATPTTSRSGGIHTLSGGSDSKNYTFHTLTPLPYLPNPTRSLHFLTRLRDDPGIRAAMAKHQFSVPLLTEMDPALHTTSDSRTLGLNRNKGQAIELRLRTDAYDGYRDYRTIRKTLCHELAHCVHSEHDRAFWDLTARIEREVEGADWTSGGRRVDEGEFYNPGEWEGFQGGGGVVDERGWSGGEYLLGGGRSGRVGGEVVEGRREMLARAAEERMRREKRRDEDGEGEDGRA